ncbi:MAG: hypothetical protein ACKO5L_00285 [Bacteroidota bacterium]
MECFLKTVVNLTLVVVFFASCQIGKDPKRSEREAKEEKTRQEERAFEREQALQEYRELSYKNELLDKEIKALEAKKTSLVESDFEESAKRFEGVEWVEVAREFAYLHSGPDESLMNLEEYLTEGVRCSLKEVVKGFAKVTYTGKKENQVGWLKLKDLRIIEPERHETSED